MPRTAVAIRAALTIVLAWGGGSATVHAQFGAEQFIDAGGSPVQDLHAADLNGDGDLDLIACRSGAPALVWYANLGGGDFGGAQAFTFQPFSALRARTLDLDDDGDLDVVASVDYYTPVTGTDNQLVLYRNLGGGSFQQDFLGSFGTSLEGLSVADLQGDGDDDVFFAAYSDATVYVKPSIVGGLGNPQVATTQASGVRDLLPRDLDGDGDADFIVASYFLNEVSWFENLNGAGNFGPKHVLNAAASGASSVDAADLDGDGDLDVLSSGGLLGVNKVHWYRNLGAGAFGAPQLVTSLGFPGAVRGVDLDTDGDNDLLVAEFLGAAWYANDGAGHFGARQVITAATIAGRTIDAPDLNNDGVPDVLLGSNPDSQARLAWFANLTDTPWTNLASGLAGGAGVPILVGTGTLVAGSAGALKLSAAAASAPALLVLSLSSTPAPFKCGTLVPVPVLASFPVATNAGGALPLAWAAWPAGLSGASLYFQYGVLDAGAACGVSLSNALRADVP